ncbi:MAG: tetratricopeptide repeat protein [Xanthobacteraceae bacterium]|nr:tetratricopeptide repeat protein [Xanthobacteraceae bacterium]
MPAPEPMQALLDEAAALHRRGALGEAAARYARVLDRDPANAAALYHLAQIYCQRSRFADGADLVRRAIAVAPSARAYVLLGRALAELGDAEAALASFDSAITLDGADAGAHGNRGDVLARLGRLEEAIESYRRAIAIEPGSLENWCNLGAAQAELGRLDEALVSYERVLVLEPSFFQGHFIRGKLRAALGQHVEALASYDRALAIAPKDVAALTGRTDALVALARPQEALAGLERVLLLDPSDVGALSNRGFLLQSLGRYDEALASFDRALALAPDHVEALANRGVLLAELGRHEDAVANYDRAVAMAPAHVRTLCNRSKSLFTLNRYAEALAGVEQALAIDPAHVESIYTRGIVLGRLRRYDEAIAAFERVLALAPAHPHALAEMTTSCLAICAWDRAAAAAGRLYEAMAAGTAIVAPQTLLQLSASPETTLAATRRYVEREVPPVPPLDFGPPVARGDRIRVAYLSGDFRVHPVAYLVAELFERHDRARFDVIGLSIGADDKSALRSRIVKSFDQFHDVRTASDRDAAALIRRLGVDIVVDLGGHTDGARPGILRYRGAPVQASYLGFAGTMGADFIDYIIADKVVLPFDQQPHYAEKIVHLPDCFLVNDATKAISPATPSRADEGLPERGFVFCCFNNGYKISADIFRVWMRLLGAVDGSVLWLSQLDRIACDNLRAAAHAAGVDPARIVFAPRKPAMADHLARQRLADVFLDTPGYNAHTTASDALWAGLPVLTCIGTTFAGRVAASLIHAVGLPELVTNSPRDYEALALRLAREPALLAGVKQRLAQHRLTHPLFNTERFARHIERAFETMREYERQGRGPQSFSVAPADP